jgi:hypothetical protein
MRRSKTWIGSIAVLLWASACARGSTLDERAHGGRDVSLRFEGTCEHLACCSAYAVPVPGQLPGSFSCLGSANTSCSQNRGWFAPAFTCNPLLPGRYRQPEDPPFLACSDTERWLSMPALRHEQCGESYLVCHRGARVIAFARDRSAPNGSGNQHIEGSLGLLQAIGANPDERETIVSVYALHERDRIAADPQCVGP